jgi:hypothetical protein
MILSFVARGVKRGAEDTSAKASDRSSGTASAEASTRRYLWRAMERCDGPWKTRAAILRSNGVQNEKRPPGNRAAFSSGRIVPTEASHQNFLGE